MISEGVDQIGDRTDEVPECGDLAGDNVQGSCVFNVRFSQNVELQITDDIRVCSSHLDDVSSVPGKIKVVDV